MSEHFGTSALKLYGLAARLLGWRPQEFWAATPAELSTALAPPDGVPAGMGRDQLNQMMERDNGNAR